MSENYIQMISQDKIYPIIRCKEASQTIEIAKALVDGGIRGLEINVENPSIYEAIQEVSKLKEWQYQLRNKKEQRKNSTKNFHYLIIYPLI